MKYHCSHSTLLAITKMIKDHKIFKIGPSNSIGHKSHTDEQQQNTFSIGCGTARLFRKHDVIVLISLQDQHIKLPDENERN